MFPNDWQEILNIIGRTRITEAHLDGACIMRYEDPEDTIKTKERPTTERSTTERSTVANAPTIPFIRDKNPPMLNDISENAQIIKYAQKYHDQDWLWTDGHLRQIRAILTHYWIDQFNILLDENCEPRWLWLQPGVAPSHILSFMKDGMQRFIHWRVCVEHARVLAHVDVSSPKMNLKSLADIVLNFSVYRHEGSSRTRVPLQHILDWESMTREVLHRLGSSPGAASTLSLGEGNLEAMLAPVKKFNAHNQ
jgi:hypothetical protein